MAATDTVIVDIPSLENAISAFKQCSNKIGANASDLQSNAGEICSAWTSVASDTYRLKIENLVKNVQSAQTALQSKIQELTDYCERSRAAEKSAQSIADSITDTGFMK